MKNIERQKTLEKAREKKGIECGQEVYCKFCEQESENSCAKAYNRMMRAKSISATTERFRYSKGDF